MSSRLSGLTVLGLLPGMLTWLKVERSFRPLTIVNHRYRSQQILNFIKDDDFNREGCIAFISSKIDTLDKGSIACYIRTIRVLCHYLVMLNKLDENFGMTIPMPKRDYKVPVILSVEEIDKVLHTDLPESYRKFKDHDLARLTFNTVIEMMAKTGARISEARDAKVSDIDFERSVWTIPNSKTHKGRLVPLAKSITNNLKILCLRKSANDLIFINPRWNSPIKSHNIQNNFNLRLKKAGIKKVATPHTLRHSFITHLLQTDCSVAKLAILCGHSNVQMTMDYSRLLVEDLTDLVNRHPLIQRDRNPYEILKHLKDTVDKFNLRSDPRFMTNIDEGNDGLRISVFVR